jgi:hypothetical protein
MIKIQYYEILLRFSEDCTVFMNLSSEIFGPKRLQIVVSLIWHKNMMIGYANPEN